MGAAGRGAGARICASGRCGSGLRLGGGGLLVGRRKIASLLPLPPPPPSPAWMPAGPRTRRCPRLSGSVSWGVCGAWLVAWLLGCACFVVCGIKSNRTHEEEIAGNRWKSLGIMKVIYVCLRGWYDGRGAPPGDVPMSRRKTAIFRDQVVRDVAIKRGVPVNRGRMGRYNYC